MEESASNRMITPFEKNLEVWRQLWRVIERSDVVVQIVDARNPLLYRSIDLEAYVREASPHKRSVLIVNKADFLSIQARYGHLSIRSSTSRSRA
jgi:large subunit GTPase 1